MSAEPSHWKAEEYEWDPHNLKATRRETWRPAEEQQDEESEGTQNEAEAGPSRPLAKSVEQRSAATGTASAEAEPPQVSTSEAPLGQQGASQGEEGSPPTAGFPSSEGTGSAEQQRQRREASGEAQTSQPPTVPIVRDTLATVHGPSKKRIPLQCQVDGCQKDLSKEKEYYQRYRICEDHLKLSSLIKDGIEQRFCQQCGRFHVLADFDGDKRSCRARLNLHNDRRRKRVPEQQTPRHDLLSPQPRGRRTRTRRKRLPFGETAGSDELDAIEAEAATGGVEFKYETRKSRNRREGRPEGSEEAGFHGSRGALRGFQPAMGFATAYRGYPVEMTAALQGLQGMLPSLSTCLPGSVIDERFMGSPTPAFTHFSHASYRNPDQGSPLSLPFASQLAADVEYQAVEWARQQHALGAQEQGDLRNRGRHESGRSRLTALQSPNNLYKSSSEPAQPGTWAAGGAAEGSASKARSDGSGSPVKEFQPQALRFRSGPGHDYIYEQHAQLLRDSSWGLRDESQRQQLQQAAADLDTQFSIPSPMARRNASESPTIAAAAQRMQPGVSMLGPRIIPGDNSLLSRFSSDRGSGIAALMSGGSDSSLTQFHPLNTQESAGSRGGGPAIYQPGTRLSVSEGASVRRINTVGGRIEPITSGQHRMVPSSSPGTPLEGAPPGQGTPPGGSGHHSSGSLQQTPPIPVRQSDPGSWTQQYSGFMGEGRRSYERYGDPERMQLSRGGLKFDVLPEGAPPNLREDYMRILGHPDAAHLEASMRPGCTHIVATALTQGPSSAGMEALQLLVERGGVWGCTEVLVQLPESTTHIRNGSLKARWEGPDNVSLRPARPLLSKLSALSGTDISVRMGPGPTPLRLLARSNGAFLADIQIETPEVVVSIPSGTGDGVLWLETEAFGVLSEPAPVVLTSNADVADEIQSFEENASSRGLSGQEVDGLVIDIGMVLQYACHASAAEATTRAAEGSAGPSGTVPSFAEPPPGCCQVTFDECWGENPRMATSAYLLYITKAAKRVAAICCREGWPALAAQVLPVAAIGLQSWPDLVVDLESLLGPRLLLHAAVSSGSFSMVLLILDLFAAFRQECSLSGSVEGITALHVAAALPDGGALSQLLLQRCSAARALWNSARDRQGRAPADIAYLINMKAAGAKGSGSAAVSLLGHQMGKGEQETPPDTPRLGDQPLTARILADRAAPFWPEGLPLPSARNDPEAQGHADGVGWDHQGGSPSSTAALANTAKLGADILIGHLQTTQMLAHDKAEQRSPTLPSRHSWPSTSRPDTSGALTEGDDKQVTLPPSTKVPESTAAPMVVDVTADAVSTGGFSPHVIPPRFL